MRRILTLACCLFLAACEPQDVRLTAFERVGSPTDTFSPQLIRTTADRSLNIRGLFPTPCEPYAATATLLLRGDTLRLLVSAQPGMPCTPSAGTSFNFSASVDGLGAGSYHVRSVHTHAGTAPADSIDYPPLVLP